MDITKLGKRFAHDRRVTLGEAKLLSQEARRSGEAGREQLAKLLADFPDSFVDQAARREVERALGGSVPSGGTVLFGPLDGGSPVFITSQGAFSAEVNGAAPQNLKEAGDVLYQAAHIVADAGVNPFASAGLPTDVRAAIFDQLAKVLENVPAGLEADDAIQLRSSAGTMLLSLLEAAPEPALRKQVLEAYAKLVEAETHAALKDSLAFNLSVSPSTRHPEVREVSDKFRPILRPARPPYEKWFANGNKTVSVDFTVGVGEFFNGFVEQLKNDSFTPVGEINKRGTLMEKTVNVPDVGETRFQVSIREGDTHGLDAMNDEKVHIVGYDGHADYGRNLTASVRNGPLANDGGASKLVFYNLCVGKGVYDPLREKYPASQLITTYGAGLFQPFAGEMIDGEGVRGFKALLHGIARREDWNTLHQRVNEGAYMRQRPFDQFISPKSVVERRRFSDLDNDGVADNIDRLYDVRVTKAEVKSELDFTPVVQDAAASTLEGTSLYFSAQMLNRLCEFSGILEDLNPDSRVTNAGFYQASADDNRIIKFDTRQADGNTEYLVKVNARYAHMSENGLRAVVAYEFGLHMKAAGLLTLNELDTKLNALCLFAKSLKVDEAYDDPEIWKAFLERYNLPTDMDLGTFVSALSSGSSFQTAGSFAALQILKERLGPEKLALLASDSAGRLKAEWF